LADHISKSILGKESGIWLREINNDTYMFHSLIHICFPGLLLLD